MRHIEAHRYTPDTTDEPHSPWVQPGIRSAFHGLSGLDGPPSADRPFRPALDTRPPLDPS